MSAGLDYVGTVGLLAGLNYVGSVGLFRQGYSNVVP